MLIRKPDQTCSPHSSRGPLLDNHRDPQIRSILGIEINFHVSRKTCGLIHSSDSDEVSQDCNVLQCSSSVLSAVHLRLVGVVCYREENAR